MIIVFIRLENIPQKQTLIQEKIQTLIFYCKEEAKEE